MRSWAAKSALGSIPSSYAKMSRSFSRNAVVNTLLAMPSSNRLSKVSSDRSNGRGCIRLPCHQENRISTAFNFRILSRSTSTFAAVFELHDAARKFGRVAGFSCFVGHASLLVHPCRLGAGLSPLCLLAVRFLMQYLKGLHRGRVRSLPGKT